MDDDIKVLHRNEYPLNLREMRCPPRKLYMRGKLADSKDQKYLCVVGSRKSTDYGRDCVRRIILGLSGYPITIVSGLAYGIDSIAHIVALEAGLHCVAFPGSTLEWDKIYPPEHLDLAKKIVDRGGALLAEWPLGYPTAEWVFAARNRLMAGLSHVTLVVEAGRRSGSLMTAKYAEDFGHDVFAVPGQIHAPQSYGTHMLIQKGAALVGSSYDVLRELGFKASRSRHNTTNISMPALLAEDKLCNRIVDALRLEDMTMDILLDRTRVSVNELQIKLSMLELEGLVKIDGHCLSLIREL